MESRPVNAFDHRRSSPGRLAAGAILVLAVFRLVHLRPGQAAGQMAGTFLLTALGYVRLVDMLERSAIDEDAVFALDDRGIYEHGFARVARNGCRAEFPVAISCESA